MLSFPSNAHGPLATHRSQQPNTTLDRNLIPTMSSTATAAPPRKALISGAGIAGTVAAYWLARSPRWDVTVVERAPALRKEGQTVDVRFEGLDVLKAMRDGKVFEAVKAACTREKGLRFVDGKGKVRAELKEDGSNSFTADVEIVRGELARILYEQTTSTSEGSELKGKVNYLFGRKVQGLLPLSSDSQKGVRVQLDDGSVDEYDILIIGDGVVSRTRALAFDLQSEDGEDAARRYVRSLDLFASGFSFRAEKDKGDDEEWSYFYGAPGRRGALVRPDGFGNIRAGFSHIQKSSEKSKEQTTRQMSSYNTPVDEQKRYWAGLCADMGWKAERLVDKLMQADDWYVAEVAQVKMPAWWVVRGREQQDQKQAPPVVAALIGDAASSPSAVTGMGTTCAIVQAYTLAAELVQLDNDQQASSAAEPRSLQPALEAYDARLRKWIEGIQSLPPGVPALANPETAWGLEVLRYVIATFAWLSSLWVVKKISSWLPASDKRVQLPDFAIFDQVQEQTASR